MGEEETVEKKLKLIALPTRDINQIEDILKKEHEKDEVPQLVVLPEYFFGKYNTEITMKPDGSFEAEKPEITEGIQRLKEAARKYNSHILFANSDRFTFGTENSKKAGGTSAFIITPSEKEHSMAVVRRKLLEAWGGKYSKRLGVEFYKGSLKTIEVNDFTVLPLVCYEFRGWRTAESCGELQPMKSIKELGELTASGGRSLNRLKKSDVVAVPASWLDEKRGKMEWSPVGGIRRLIKQGICKDTAHYVISDGSKLTPRPASIGTREKGHFVKDSEPGKVNYLSHTISKRVRKKQGHSR